MNRLLLLVLIGVVMVGECFASDWQEIKGTALYCDGKLVGFKTDRVGIEKNWKSPSGQEYFDCALSNNTSNSVLICSVCGSKIPPIKYIDDCMKFGRSYHSCKDKYFNEAK